MNILVLNGSPKGDLSVTMQYANYLAKLNPNITFTTYNVAQQIRKIEKDEAYFNEIIEQVRHCDAVLWAFPLYILVVHAHYKRFIELLLERGAQDAFAGKYAATLSTSIHYFDHTAHNYMHGICDDLGMRFVEAFSPEMTDLLQEEGRQQTAAFGKRFFHAIETQVPVQRQNAPLVPNNFVYQPGPIEKAHSTGGKKVVILHDGPRAGSNLEAMVARCRSALSGNVEVINLRELEIKASCQGCLQCGYDNRCAFEGKDGFIDFYRDKVLPVDIIIYAGTIVDRYLSSRWKMFFDRSFFNTHTPMLGGKQIAFLLSGPFSQLANLREILQGYAEFQMANVVGYLSDECSTSEELDALIDHLMAAVIDCSQEKASRPMTFLGHAGLKLFRDDMWGRLRMVFIADHRAYQRMGVYRSFPQADWRQRLINLVIVPLMGITKFREQFNRVMTRQMVQPLKTVVEKSGVVSQPPRDARQPSAAGSHSG